MEEAELNDIDAGKLVKVVKKPLEGIIRQFID
jgi:hypothetical protein